MRRFVALILIKALVFAGLVVFGAAPVQAWPFHGSPTSQCNTPGFADNGCAASAQPAQLLNTSIGTTSVQDGGTNILASHPMQFYVPVWDYAIGPVGVPFKDPATVAVTGCSYQATGNAGLPQMNCNSAGVAYNFNLFDFSGAHTAGNPGCIKLLFGPTANLTASLTNNLFRYSAGCGAVVSRVGSVVITGFNNEIDGNSANNSDVASMFVDTSSGTPGPASDWEYNYMHDIGGRFGSATRGFGAFTYNYNYVYNLGSQTTPGGIHGEIILNGGQGSTQTFQNANYKGNLIVYPSSANQITMDTTIYCATGTTTLSRGTLCNADSNVIVINKSQGGLANAGFGILVHQWSGVDALSITNNWYYGNGGQGCAVNGAQNSANTGSTNGNTFTATLIHTMIIPGMLLSGAGFTSAVVQPYGTTDPNTGLPSTGTGNNTGTYIYDGGSQTVGSQTFHVTPIPVTSNFTGNVDLGSGNPIVLTLPTLTTGAC